MPPMIHTDVCIDDLDIADTDTKGRGLDFVGDGVRTLSAGPSTNGSTAIFWIVSVAVTVALPKLLHDTATYTERWSDGIGMQKEDA